MKYVLLALLTIAVVGCSHNKFDVSKDQIVSHRKSLPKADEPPHEVVKIAGWNSC